MDEQLEAVSQYSYRGSTVEIKKGRGKTFYGFVDDEQISKRTSEKYARKGAELYIDNQRVFEEVRDGLLSLGYTQVGDKEGTYSFYTFESPDGDRRFAVRNATDRFDRAFVVEKTHGIHGPNVEHGFRNKPKWGETDNTWRADELAEFLNEARKFC